MSDSSPSPGPARRRFAFAMSSSDDDSSPIKARTSQPASAAAAAGVSTTVGPAAPAAATSATAASLAAAEVPGASLAAMMDAASTPSFSSGGDDSDDDLDLPGQRSVVKALPDPAPHETKDDAAVPAPAVAAVEVPTPVLADTSEPREEPTAAAPAVAATPTPPRSRRHSIHLSSSSSSSSSAPSPIRKPADTTAQSTAGGADNGLTPGTMQRELQQMSSVSDAASPAPPAAADSGSFTLAATAHAPEQELAATAQEQEEEDALEITSSAADSSAAGSPLAPVRQSRPAMQPRDDSTPSSAESTPEPSPEKRPPPSAGILREEPTVSPQNGAPAPAPAPKLVTRPLELKAPPAAGIPSKAPVPSSSQASTDAGFRPNNASKLRRATSAPRRQQDEEAPPVPVPRITKYPLSSMEHNGGDAGGDTDRREGPRTRVDHMYRWAQARDAKREQAAAELRRREEERRSTEATSCTFKPSITRYAAQQPTRAGGYAANHAQLRRQREEEAAEELRHELHGRPTINAISDAIVRRKQTLNNKRDAYVVDRLERDAQAREKRQEVQARVLDQEQQTAMVGSRQPPVSGREADRRARQQWEWDARRQEAVAKLRELKETEHLVAGGSGRGGATRVTNMDEVVERLFRPRCESPLEALANEDAGGDEFTPYVSDVSDSLAAHAKLRCLKSWFEFLAGTDEDAVLSVQAAVASSQRPEAPQILKLLARSLHTHAAVEGMTLDEFVDFAAELEAVYGPQQWCTQGPTRRGCSAVEPAAKNSFRPQVSKQSADIVARTRPARQRHADPALRLYDERLAIERRRANLRAEVEELERPSFHPETVPYAGIPPADINRQPSLVSPSRSALHRQRHSGRAAAAAATSLEPDVDIIDAIEAHRRRWEAAQRQDEGEGPPRDRGGAPSADSRTRGPDLDANADTYEHLSPREHAEAYAHLSPETLINESVQTVAPEVAVGEAEECEECVDPEPHVGAPSPSRRPDSAPHTTAESEARARSASHATDATAMSAQPTDASMREGSGSASRARTDRSATSAVSSKARSRPFANSDEFLLRVDGCRPRSVHDVAARDIGAVPEHDKRALHAIGRDMAAQQGEELARMFAMAQKGRPAAAAKTKRAPVATPTARR